MGHGAVIDCKASTLAVGMNPRFEVPISVARGETAALSSVVFEQAAVSLLSTIEIPARSVAQVVAHVQVPCGQEGVIDPLGIVHEQVFQSTSLSPEHWLKSDTNTTWFYSFHHSQ